MTLPAKTLAVVTGATVGIGQVFAERLARRGHNLLLIARDVERLNTVAAEISRTHGVSARVMPADLAVDDDLERVALALAGEPDLGVMVNNAGFGTKGRIHDSDLEPQMRMVRLHVLALMRLSQAVLPGMVARKRGWLINVSSIAGYLYSPGNANYNATKGYQRQFTQALNTELTGTGVYVQALCPGFTHTDFHRRVGIDKSTIPGFLWSSAESVVDASIRAAERERPLVLVPGFTNKVIMWLARMAPHSVLRRGRPGAKNEDRV